MRDVNEALEAPARAAAKRAGSAPPPNDELETSEAPSTATPSIMTPKEPIRNKRLKKKNHNEREGIL